MNRERDELEKITIRFVWASSFAGAFLIVKILLDERISINTFLQKEFLHFGMQFSYVLNFVIFPLAVVALISFVQLLSKHLKVNEVKKQFAKNLPFLKRLSIAYILGFSISYMLAVYTNIDTFSFAPTVPLSGIIGCVIILALMLPSIIKEEEQQ